jgi:hypothetical protein
MSRSFPGGAGHIVYAGDTAALDITGTALTISAWFNWGSAGYGEIVSKSIPGARQYRLMVDASPAKLKAGVGDGASTEDLAVGTTTVPQNSWQHGLLRKNGTGANALQAWLNGVSEASITSNVSIGNTANNVSLGQQPDQNTSARLIGQIAQVAIWNVAISDIEIIMLSRGVSPYHIRPHALRGYWALWGASPEPDWSGYASHMTVAGTSISSINPRVGALLPPRRLIADTLPLGTQTTDAATVLLNLTADGGECFSQWTAEFLGEGDALPEWYSQFVEAQFSGDAVPEWSPGEISREGAHC